MTHTEINLSPQELEHLVGAFSSTALVILRCDAILMKAGGLSPRGFQDFSSALQRFWHVSAPAEINRYVGLSIDQQFYFLHAKFLPQGEFLLGLMFPLQTPLSRIRQDMREMQHCILDKVQLVSDRDDTLEQSLQSNLVPYPEHNPESLTQPTDPGWSLEIDQDVKKIKDEPVSEQPTNPLFNDENSTFNKEEQLHSAGFPDEDAETEGASHDPEMLMEEIPWQPVEIIMTDETEPIQAGLEIPSGVIAQQHVEDHHFEDHNNPWQSLVELPPSKDDLASILQNDFDLNQDIPDGEEMPLSLFYGFNSNVVRASAPQKGDLDATEEKMNIAVYDVTFVLVPRSVDHQLLGDVSVRLYSWLITICETYGWQLDDLSVRPNFVKWTLCDFPETLISEMLAIIRSETSKKILREFPEFQQDGQARDFWSTGYLVDMKNREISSQAVLSHLSTSRLDRETP